PVRAGRRRGALVSRLRSARTGRELAGEERVDDALERCGINRRLPVRLALEDEAAGAVVHARFWNRRRDIPARNLRVVDLRDRKGKAAGHLPELRGRGAVID